MLRFALKTLVIGSVVMVVVLVVAASVDSSPRKPAARAPTPTVAQLVGHDASKAQERQAWIDKALNQDQWLRRIRVANRVGRAYVEKGFVDASTEDQRVLATVLWAWALDNDPNCTTLVIHDAHTEREVGQMSQSGYAPTR